MRIAILILACLTLLIACSDQDVSMPTGEGRKIVSLDYCADQYVLKLAEPENILALSPDATASFSYFREEAKSFPTVRPRAEDVLLLKPDIVVRTYGGGPNATAFFEHSGISVVQIGYASDLNGVKAVIESAAQQMDAESRGSKLMAEMDSRLNALPNSQSRLNTLYLTSKGAVAGKQTMIDDLMSKAGVLNFQQASGWTSIPLERLAYESPQLIATGFFETSDLNSDRWTPARHPVAQRALAEIPLVNIPGAWTACGAWFLLDAVEALADARSKLQ